MKFLAFFLTLNIAPAIASTEMAPDWFLHPPENDPDYFYSVGNGEEESESKALQEAEDQAWLSLVETHFGVNMKGSIKSHSRNDQSTVVKRMTLTTDLIPTRGVETIERKIIALNQGVKAYVLRRFPTAELEKAKILFLKNQRHTRPTAQLVIRTHPSEAFIKLNGIAYGKSPLNLMVPTGNYTVRTEKQGYESITRNIGVEGVQTTELSLALTPVSGTLKIRFSGLPETLTIDSESQKAEVSASITLPPGDHMIRASKNGFLPIEKPITIAPGKTFQLQLDFQTSPRQVSPPPKPAEAMTGHEFWVREINAAIHSRKTSEIVRTTDSYLNFVGMNSEVLIASGIVHLGLYHLEIAEQRFKAALSLQPSSAAFEGLCEIKMYQRHYTDSRQYCQQAVKLDATNPAPLVLLSKVEEESENLNDAYHYLRAATVLKPKLKSQIQKFCKLHRYDWRLTQCR